jgi:hypothetical protein
MQAVLMERQAETQKLTREHEKAAADVKETRETHDELAAELHSVQISLTRGDAELTQSLERLWEDYEITRNDALTWPEPLLVTAETWRADGAVVPAEDPPGSYGRLLARLVTALSGLDPAPLVPPPPWLRYDHRAADRLWAPVAVPGRDPEDVVRDLPPGLVGHARLARERLLAADLPSVIGHPDLNGAHVRWLDGPGGAPLPVVHGWDELTARPEAVLVGCLAANYHELPDEPRLAPVVQGERVLAAYQAESGRSLSADELEVAWAASLWVAAHNAAMEHVNGAAGQVTHQLVLDAPLRLHLAGG